MHALFRGLGRYLRRLAAMFLPMRFWYRRVNANTLEHDFWAGLTGAVLVLPQGIAFAVIAGLPPEFGLYSAVIVSVIAVFFGSSLHLVTGPTVALSIVIPGILAPYAVIGSPQYIGLSLTLMLIVGVIQLAFGLFRLGGLVNFISHSVIIGFTAGAGILIMISQLPAYLGISLPAGLRTEDKLSLLISRLPQWHAQTVVIATTTLMIAVLIRRYNRRLPYMLLGMLAGSGLCYLLDGAAQGVKMLGALPASAPQMALPKMNLYTLSALLPSAFALALLGLIEAVSIARAIALRSQQAIDGNQEFFGQGLANIVGSFFSCYVASGSFNRSGVNYDSGAKTPFAVLFTALFVLIVLLFAPKITRWLPLPAMAGAIILAGFNLFDFKHIKLIAKTSHHETAIIVVTFLSTLFLNLEFAIYVGVITSLVLYLQKIAHPVLTYVDFSRVNAQAAAVVPPVVLRLDGSLFFGSIAHVQNCWMQMQATYTACPWKNVVILAEGLNRVDVAGLEMLTVQRHKLRRAGGDLFIIGMKPFVLAELKKTPYWEKLGGKAHLYESTYVAFRSICIVLGIKNYRSYMKHLFRDYNKL